MSTPPNVCPRCSSAFDCGIDTGACWCASVEVTAARRAAYAEYYDGCLCRDCLVALDRDRPQAPSTWAFLVSQLRRKRSRPT